MIYQHLLARINDLCEPLQPSPQDMVEGEAKRGHAHSTRYILLFSFITLEPGVE
jgi:hypothetical protein